MKLIKLPHQKGHILSPWLTQEEAANYCGISREKFRQLQKQLPCPATGGTENNKRYITYVIDEWWKRVGTKKDVDIE